MARSTSCSSRITSYNVCYTKLLREIETTANLQHPHILPLFDSGEADGFLFYVMPYVQGETLADKIAREKQLPVDEALGIATSVASARNNFV